MFDIGFSELMLVGVIALVVLGPERLPKVARTAGHLLGKLQRYVAQVKAEISQELDISELQKAKSQFQEAAQSWQQAVTSEVSKTEQALNEAAADVRQAVTPGAPSQPGSSSQSSPQLELVEAEPSPQLELGLGADHAAKPNGDHSSPPKAGHDAGTVAAEGPHRP